jgi:hypothetical protein
MSDTQKVETHPIQTHNPPERLPKVVTMRAYQVYCAMFGSQEALVTGGCRGGFSISEVIAFLYARTFPEKEWSARFDEALHGMREG